MSIIIDLIIVGIIALCIFLGYKKGLTKAVFDIFSFIIAIVLSVILFNPVSAFVKQNTQIDDNIKQSVISIVKDDGENEEKVKEDSNLPQAMVDYINETIENTAKEVKKNAVEVAAEKISDVSINIGVGIILFIAIRLILMIVGLFLKMVTDLPIIKQFDKTGGIAYGVLKGGIIVFVILALISFISPMIEQTGLVVAINKSFIGGLLYNNNILLKLIF